MCIAFDVLEDCGSASVREDKHTLQQRALTRVLQTNCSTMITRLAIEETAGRRGTIGIQLTKKVPYGMCMYDLDRLIRCCCQCTFLGCPSIVSVLGAKDGSAM